MLLLLLIGASAGIAPTDPRGHAYAADALLQQVYAADALLSDASTHDAALSGAGGSDE